MELWGLLLKNNQQQHQSSICVQFATVQNFDCCPPLPFVPFRILNKQSVDFLFQFFFILSLSFIFCFLLNWIWLQLRDLISLNIWFLEMFFISWTFFSPHFFIHYRHYATFSYQKNVLLVLSEMKSIYSIYKEKLTQTNNCKKFIWRRLIINNKYLNFI